MSIFGDRPSNENKKRLTRSFAEGEDMVDGASNTKKIETIDLYNSTTSEHIIANGNCDIILGKDRPGDPESGYGGLGYDDTSAIRLTVGRGNASRSNSNKAVQNNMGSLIGGSGDAAYIYMSQTADIDTYMQLPPNGRPELSRGKEDNISLSIAESAIGMRADAIRIVGTRSIKLVTGNRNARDSKDTAPNVIHGIDIIAGGKYSEDSPTGIPYLQPMVKGLHLRDSLLTLTDMVKQINSELMRLTKVVLFIQGAMEVDIRYPDIDSVPGIPTFPLSEAARIVLIQNLSEISRILSSTEERNLTSFTAFESDYYGQGPRSILSKHNNVN